MSSWTSSPFPPEAMRRRSRSRSPERRGFDRFDREWGREREWTDYERERAEWDYRRNNGMGMRQRSRSPGVYDDRRLKRRRSMSPPYGYERDRYEPRPRYGEDYYDNRGPPPGRYSPPQRGYRPYSPPRPSRGLVDPYDLDYPATFRYFSDWFRLNYPGVAADEEAQSKTAETSNNKAGSPMKKRYDEYRRGIVNQQIQILFDHHKASAWFLERYDLSEQYASLRTRTRKIGWKGKIDEFIQKLEQGKLDPVLELDATPPANATTSQPSDPDQSQLTEQNGEDVDIMNEESRPDEDMDIAMFEGDVNGEGSGGLLSSSTNGNGKAQGNATSAQAEEVSVEPEGVQIMIRTIPPDIGRLKIEEICSKIPGFMYLALGDPMQKRNYYRCGWIRFADDINITDTVTKLSEAKIDGFRMHVSHSTRPFTSKARVAPSASSRPERVLVDLEKMRKLATILEDQADQLSQTNVDESEMEPAEPKDRGTIAVEARAKQLFDMLDEKFAGAEDEKLTAKKNSVALDLYLAYLRNAFNCCYYCAAVTDHSEELLRKCIKHIRAAPKTTEDWKDARWTEWLDAKVALLIDRDNVDPIQYGGKDPQKELAKICEPHVKREDEGKFRCNLCSKLFKAESFVEKHISNKHSEVVTALAEVPFFNMFALDPHRIQPFAHAPPANGGIQAPPQAYGLRSAREPSNAGYPDMSRQPFPVHPYPPPPMSFGGPHGEYPPPPPDPYFRRRSPPPPRGHRRLSDRLGERQFEHTPLILTGIEGLPPKPMTIAEPMSMTSDRGLGDRQGSVGTSGSAPLPPPGKVKEDPRAASGRKVSYLDMDEVAEGDVELSY
ncbi:hypothetical protein FRB99_002455 [Tulasnella sp. 403]|nr:hypothetical protein FRB99_002455 [Tulasnella sp. 403]